MARVSSTWFFLLIVAVLGAGLRAAESPSAPSPTRGTAADDSQPLAWLKSANYAALEDYYSRQQQDYEAGGIADEQLYASFRRLYEDSPDNERFFDRWLETYPSSYAAVLAHGVYLYRMAWAARGDRYIRDTPASQVEAMKNYLARARPDLLASLKLTDKPYLSTLYLLNVAMLKGTATERRQWYEQGTAIDPHNTLLRYRYMFSLRPRWGGSYGEMQAFLEQCRRQQLPPELLARLDLLIHADLAEDAMRGSDNQKIFDEWRQVLTLAAAAGEEPSTLALIGYTRAAQDLQRTADAAQGLKALDGRNPRDAWSQGRLGWIYLQAHEDDKAWTFLTRAADQDDPWAQFVVGHSTYDGVPTLHKAPDKDAGLVWIRRSAAQCFPDAVQFLAARGERPVSDCRRRSNEHPDRWVDLIRFGGVLLTSLVTGLVAASRKRKAGAADHSGRLRHPPSTLIIGVLALGVFLALAGLALFADNGSGGPIVSAAFAAFGVLGLLTILQYVRVRHELTADGLEYGRLFGPRGSLKWRDVTRLSYSGMRWFRIETASGEVVRISAMLTGLPEFARAVLEQVPSYAFEGTTRDVLQAVSLGQLPKLAS